MSQNFQTNYQPLGGDGAPDHDSVSVDFDGEREDDLSPDTHSSMVFHVVPKSSKSRWNHIEDLDTFFKRVYHYHQNYGLFCMMLQHGSELLQYMFVVVFSTFLITCVDYQILFGNRMPDNINPKNFTSKIHIWDVIRSHDDIVKQFNFLLIFLIVVATIVWLVRVGYVVFMFFQFWEIKLFFNNALGMQDKELGNITWEEVQQRLMEVQVRYSIA